MTGWLIALGVLVVLWLLGRIRLGIQVEYNQGATTVRLRIGPFPITLYPQKEVETPAEPGSGEKEKTGKTGQARDEEAKAAPFHSAGGTAVGAGRPGRRGPASEDLRG